ncbi:hypothetical protein [Phaeovulum sp.]|uniref:hypothetical protein n=1 Tax=Phaeovulum sp. TaxID=2934796 RepID=UPI00272FD3B5|nr:hypothetical protein [Phaeovulum sp.]MDP1669017.1 hypothetical protein [Phaeovulum sp.]MDZ4117986.1 hypothetical protein [Phaeovulum sp.]
MRNASKLVIAAAGITLALPVAFLLLRGSPDAVSAIGTAAAAHPASVAAPPEAVVALPVLAALPPRPLPRDAGATLTAAARATQPSCAAASLRVETAAAAMLSVRLSAPCLPGARVELRHGALAFAVLTDTGGIFEGRIPALTREATVQATLPDGARLAASALVGTLDTVERTALVAGASGALHLNAFENGAGFGDAGHRHPAAPGTPGTGPGGYLTYLGDAAARPALFAEIYTAAVGQPEAQLAIEAELTAATCGTDLAASVLRAGKSAPLAITIAMPACDGIEGAVLLPLPAAPVALAAVDQR